MKRRKKQIDLMFILHIMIALIPYAFIGLYCDAVMTKFTLLGYGVTLFCMVFLLATGRNKKQKYLIFFLSIVSFVESYVLAKYFLGKEWNYYFKPFVASNLVVGIMGFFLLIQLLRLILKKEKSSRYR